MLLASELIEIQELEPRREKVEVVGLINLANQVETKRLTHCWLGREVAHVAVGLDAY